MLDYTITGLRKIILTCFFWSVIGVANLIAVIIIIPQWLLGEPKSKIRDTIEFVIAEIPTVAMRIMNLWKVEYKYNITSKHKYNESFVIVANHISLIDTIFTAQLPYDKVYTWKHKWAYAPVFGQLCLMAGHITIDPTNTESKRQAIQKSKTYLSCGKSVIFYPEGTRNRKDPTELMPFKTGAFRVAHQTRTKILPVTIIGTQQACNGFVCDVGSIKIIIDDPIEVTDVETGILKVREIMETNISKY